MEKVTLHKQKKDAEKHAQAIMNALSLVKIEAKVAMAAEQNAKVTLKECRDMNARLKGKAHVESL